jgi:nuclear mRNA export protein SAC3
VCLRLLYDFSEIVITFAALQSLKEFYEDQRGRYESPNELEMRVYHRLIHIRDQKERHEDIPVHIIDHPVFKLTTRFRLHVQAKSAPIGRSSPLVVDNEGMQIFNELAVVLREQGSVVMIYLVACILERLFGKETIDDIESIRGGLSIPDLIDGTSTAELSTLPNGSALHADSEMDDFLTEDKSFVPTASPIPLRPSATEWLTTNFGPKPTASAIFGPSFSNGGNAGSAFSSLSSSPNPFGSNATFGSPVPTTFPRHKSVFEATAGPSNFLPQTEALANVSSSTNEIPSMPESQRPYFTETSAPPASSFFEQFGTPSSVLQSNLDTFPSGQESQQTIGRSSQIPFPPGLIASALNPQAPTFTPLSTQPKPPADKRPSLIPITPPQPPPPDIYQSSGSNAPPLFPTAARLATPESLLAKPSAPLPGGVNKLPSQPSFSSLPSLHKIDTQSLEKGAGVFGPDPPLSPAHPPPLSKQQPISLPPTPTLPVKSIPPKTLLDTLKSQVSTSNSPELLSPLYLASPATSPTRNPAGNGAPSHLTSIPLLDPGSKHPKDQALLNGKGKEPAIDLDAMAITFSRKGLLVKECFGRWRKRATDRAAWIEACEQSDRYRQKIQRERKFRVPPPEKKRRMSTALPQSPQKRIRRRISNKYRPPIDDEKLAQRFQEVQLSHIHPLRTRHSRTDCIIRIKQNMNDAGPRDHSSMSSENMSIFDMAHVLQIGKCGCRRTQKMTALRSG